MAATAVDVGFGTSITFQSGLLAKITSVSHSGFSRNMHDSSHMSSTNGYRTFVPGDLKDPGEVTVELLFDKNAAVKTVLEATASATCTIGYPTPQGGSTGGSTACSAFLQSFEFTAPMDGMMTATAVVKFTGEPTLTDGS